MHISKSSETYLFAIFDYLDIKLFLLSDDKLALAQTITFKIAFIPNFRMTGPWDDMKDVIVLQVKWYNEVAKITVVRGRGKDVIIEG